MAKEKSAIERFAESKFMRKLQEGSQKLASNEIFSTISGGMGATMGLIMVGAVIQIVCAVAQCSAGILPVHPIRHSICPIS